MKESIVLICFMILGWSIAASDTWGQAIFLTDDFESGILSPIWTTRKMPENGFRFIDSPTRSGQGALEISVFPRVQTEIGGDGQLTERAEIREAPEVRLRMGMESCYAFSFFLPPDFPIVNTRLVIARWKQSFNDPRKDRSPMVSLRYMMGQLRVDIARKRGKRSLYKDKIDVRNRWVDMVFRIIPKSDNKGLLQVWKDGRQIVHYHGALGFEDDNDEIYFKLGLYRDHMTVPMRIIYDRFRRAGNVEELNLSGK